MARIINAFPPYGGKWVTKSKTTMETLRDILRTQWQTSLRLETCRLIYSRHGDSQTFRKEVVPRLIPNHHQYDAIIENDLQTKDYLSYIRELVIWDIATKTRGREGNGQIGGHDFSTGNYP